VTVARSELAQLILENNLALEEREQLPTGPALERLRQECAHLAERSEVIAELVRPALTGGRPRVLEVGVGYLYLVSTLRRLLGDGFDLYGLEHPSRAYLTLPSFADRARAYGLELATCDLLDGELPWPGLELDAVVFADVVEHLPPTAVPGVLSRLAARVRGGGRLVVSSPNLGSFSRIASLAFGTGRILDLPVPSSYAGDTYGHLRLYARAEVEELVRGAGLQVAEWRYLNYERVLLERDSLAGRLLHAGQVAAPRLRARWATSWACAATRPAQSEPSGS
jgi:SAM-dependent methyltransferase